MVSILFALLFSTGPARAGITIVNASTYPWLKTGAYANYTSVFGDAPAFVLQNGTVLLSVPPAGPPTLPQGTTNTTLDWSVLNRVGGMASISVRYRITGCEYSEADVMEHENCNHFNFGNSEVLDVNISNGEAYLGGKGIGELNFWGAPLLDNGTAYSGTAFVNGVGHDSLANVTVYLDLNLGIRIVTPGGAVAAPDYVYRVVPALYGVGPNSVFAWEKISGAAFYNGGKLITVFPMFAPSGVYDYYSGLGIQISGPSYPINRTVCSIRNGQIEGCQVATYATTLGNFSHSDAAELDLASTNVPLGPNQPASTSTTSESQSYLPGTSETFLVVVPILASAVALTGVYYLRFRRSGHSAAFKRTGDE